MSSPRSFVFGVDLDGVVADFIAGLREVAAEWLGEKVESLPTEITYGLPEWNLAAMGGYDALHRFAVTQRDLFRKLRPIQNAPAVLRRLSANGIRIRIITHRLFIEHFHKEAADQTVAWLDHHGIPYWDLCLMQDKAAVGADLYIDDSPQNVESLREQGNDVITFTNSTNRHLGGLRAGSWDEVEQIVRSRLEIWDPASTARRPASRALLLAHASEARDPTIPPKAA